VNGSGNRKREMADDSWDPIREMTYTRRETKPMLHNRGPARVILRYDVIDGDTLRAGFSFNRRRCWADLRLAGIDAPDPKREHDPERKRSMQRLSDAATRDMNALLAVYGHRMTFTFERENGNEGWTPRSRRPVVRIHLDDGTILGSDLSDRMLRRQHVIEWTDIRDNHPWRHLSTTAINTMANAITFM